LVGLIVYRKPIWFLALLCSATLFYMGLEVGILLSHRESVNQLGAAYFSDNGPQLIEVDIEGALPERVRRAIMPIVPTDTSGKPFHAFVVKDCRESALVAFTNPIGSGFVFLREMPDLQSAVGRFKLFHELGHLSSTARFNSFIETSMKLRFFNTFGVVFPQPHMENRNCFGNRSPCTRSRLGPVPPGTPSGPANTGGPFPRVAQGCDGLRYRRARAKCGRRPSKTSQARSAPACPSQPLSNLPKISRHLHPSRLAWRPSACRGAESPARCEPTTARISRRSSLSNLHRSDKADHLESVYR
jgi:hypothetical protein